MNTVNGILEAHGFLKYFRVTGIIIYAISSSGINNNIINVISAMGVAIIDVIVINNIVAIDSDIDVISKF